MKPYIPIFLITLILFSCSKDDSPTTAQTEVDIIQYIEANNLDATKSASGLYYVVTNQGNGEKPNANSNVTVRYKGYFLDGKVFDQSGSQGISFNLQQVIKGWTEGITYFNEGGEGILIIPSNLGYGSNNYNGIPGGSVLVFDIKLIKVN
jgi:FKBP-type peptidyl-prolyl cis-trans isomerase FkpA